MSYQDPFFTRQTVPSAGIEADIKKSGRGFMYIHIPDGLSAVSGFITFMDRLPFGI